MAEKYYLNKFNPFLSVYQTYREEQMVVMSGCGVSQVRSTLSLTKSQVRSGPLRHNYRLVNSSSLKVKVLLICRLRHRDSILPLVISYYTYASMVMSLTTILTVCL